MTDERERQLEQFGEVMEEKKRQSKEASQATGSEDGQPSGPDVGGDQENLYAHGRPQDTRSPRAKNAGKGKKTADGTSRGPADRRKPRSPSHVPGDKSPGTGSSQDSSQDACLVSVMSIHGCQLPSSSSACQWPVIVSPSSLKVPVKQSDWLRISQTSRPSSSRRVAS